MDSMHDHDVSQQACNSDLTKNLAKCTSHPSQPEYVQAIDALWVQHGTTDLVSRFTPMAWTKAHGDNQPRLLRADVWSDCPSASALKELVKEARSDILGGDNLAIHDASRVFSVVVSDALACWENLEASENFVGSFPRHGQSRLCSDRTNQRYCCATTRIKIIHRLVVRFQHQPEA